MPKKKIEKPQHEMTHRQLSHWQKQQRLQRIVFITGIVLIVAVVALIGVGLFLTKIQPARELSEKMSQEVLKIDNTNYDLDYLTDAMAFYIKAYKSFGLEPDVKNVSMYANSAVQNTEGNFLIVEAVSKLNTDSVSPDIAAQIKLPIKVSDDDINKYIKDNKLSDKQFTKDSVHRQLLIDKIKSDYFSPQLPAQAEHRDISAMLLESQAQADQVIARINNGEAFSDIAGALSLDKTTKDKKGIISWLPKGILSSVLTNVDTADATLLEDKIFSSDIVPNQLTTLDNTTITKNTGYWLIKVAETTDEDTKAHVYGMLLSSQQQAEEIKAKLAAGGEGNDWDTLAKANSQDSASAGEGGDLGLKAKGVLSAVVDAVVFDANGKVILAKDTVTGPLADTTQTTKGGVWLIQVKGIEQQTTSDANRKILLNTMLNDWFNQYTKDNTSRFTNDFNPDQQQFAYNEALKR